MAFFNSTVPIFRRKPPVLDVQDAKGIVRIRLRIKQKTLFHRFYTRIDRVLMLWGLISAIIFFTAQFSPISWIAQAIAWSILSLVGSIATIVLTYVWVKAERLRWLLYCWVGLMMGGVVLTNLGIFLGWGQILLNLCNLWLILMAVGYFFTSWGLRSRAFAIAGFFHLIGIILLPAIGGSQFLITGILIVATLFFFAEVQWDMSLPLKQNLRFSRHSQSFKQQSYTLRQLRQASTY
ncbi:hypothetical protein IQ249_01880 [Lusitaniella coriacea LEGE 07157]|uniref:Uncharacterized protein n=1 Tax=Lusitaniella coriacea LEGE 07157 TaxID=945747 RepID=A0A8J7DU00_9CYAN|nr:hypothetical protein [Lusitaniella coriacea]MBE9114636.1 hypothetical protein [Lusitaniella coriacea LEGE 07157]